MNRKTTHAQSAGNKTQNTGFRLNARLYREILASAALSIVVIGLAINQSAPYMLSAWA